MTHYYNEIDPYCCAWLKNLMEAGLIPDGDIDDRDIRDVRASELTGYSQCHFFAGIAGWSRALQLAGWPADRPVWTGSCPCQPFSNAGKRKGTADKRHLWPLWFALIRERHPECLFGEQVASAIIHGWLDGVFADLEAEGYTCGAVVLPACSVGAPHIRQRLWWVADTTECRPQVLSQRNGESFPRCEGLAQGNDVVGCSNDGGLADGIEPGLEGLQEQPARQERQAIERSGVSGGLGNTDREGPQQGQPASSTTRYGGAAEPTGRTFWSDFDLIPCADGKSRRIEPGTCPLAHGVSGRVVVRRTLFKAGAEIQEEHWYSRIGALRALGNAIVPHVAAEFIKACIEERTEP